jgi:hypothetical protein
MCFQKLAQPVDGEWGVAGASVLSEMLTIGGFQSKSFEWGELLMV